MKFNQNEFSYLDKKIPPPIVAILCGFLMKLLSQYGPVIYLANTLKLSLCGVFILIVLTIDISAILSFRKSKTTINPLKPNNTSKLVAHGVYKISRNPMYLGMVLLLCSWGIYLGALFALIVIPCFVYYITSFQIIPEEKALKSLFGHEFYAYQLVVRRWL